MFKKIVALVSICVITASAPSFAQSNRVEVSVWGGWIFSDGVSGSSVLAGDGNLYDRVDLKDSVSFGVSGGVLFTENTEAGFMFGRQFSKLQLGGTDERDVGDLNVDTYHGYLAYNWGAIDSRIRPFVFGGLGATRYGDVDFQTPVLPGTVGGVTKFSTTWGAGLKYFPASRFGIRAAARVTPTYIKSDAEGWWCDPFWGCYLIGDPQYSNQIELSGGVTFRF